MPVLDGNRLPEERLGPEAGDRLEHELVRLLVEQEDRGGLGAEDRPRHLDHRLEEPPERLLGADDSRRDRCLQVLAHFEPPTFDEVR